MPRLIRPAEGLSLDYSGLASIFEFDNQDGRWSGFNCGQAAACTLLHVYGRITPRADEMRRVEQQFPPDLGGGWLGTSRSQVERICRSRSLPLQEIRGEAALRDWLRANQPVIVMLQCQQRRSTFGVSLPVGHWMVAYGFDESFVYLTNWGRMSWDDFRRGWQTWLPRFIGMVGRGLVARFPSDENAGRVTSRSCCLQ